MIALLNGKLIAIESESLIIDVSGVGYQVSCTGNTLSQLSLGDLVKLHIYTHVREDQFQLFGFLDAFEKTLFLSLIKVNGIGPKMAMQALSGARPETIVEWIEAEDVKAIMKLPKLGKKKAEQLILTLKGKLVFAESNKLTADPVRREVRSALVNLGYPEEQVDVALGEMGGLDSTESGVRKGLSILSAGL